MIKAGSGLITIDKIILNRKKHIYNINHPDKLLEFIHQNLTPKEIEKKERGEVFTPIKLVNEMLDTLPKDVWKNKDLKWLDPAAGIGNFPVVVYMRLMVSLEDIIKDKEERKKHIIENMLYMVELNKKNVYLMRKIFCGMTYKLNVFEGSFIETEETKSKVIKLYKPEYEFDIIIGNPPYPAVDKNGKTISAGNSLWVDFINMSFYIIKKNGYLLFITPYSWMSPSSKNKEVFYDNFIIHLNINECKKYFKDIASDFSYYLIKKTNRKKETKIICQYEKEIYKSKFLITNFKFLPTLLCDKSLSIIEKFYNNKLQKISFKTSSEIHTQKKDLISKIKTAIYKYENRNNTSSNIYSKIKHSLSDKNKILLNRPSYLKPIYDNGNLGFTQDQMYFLTDNKKYLDILNSKLYSFIFKICKWSGFNNQIIFENIPYIKQFKNDNDLYNLFKLTIDERNLINKIMKNEVNIKELKVKSLSLPMKSKYIGDPLKVFF